MSSIPITIAPQTAWGRPIQDAYWFCWVSGFNLCITMGALGYCMITKGFRKDLGTIMQYICHFFAIINIWMCYFNLLYPFGCDPMPWSTYAFSISEIACDSYLLMIVIALIPPGGASQKKKYAWYVLYFLCEYVTRILQYVFISYAPIFTLCRAVTHPTVSLVTTFFKIAFIVAMGVAMVLTLFASKSDVVSTVGFKSIIAAILMILAKIVLFIPFGFAPLGMFTVIFTISQLGVQSGILILLMIWKPTNLASKINKMSSGGSKQVQSATGTSSSQH